MLSEATFVIVLLPYGLSMKNNTTTTEHDGIPYTDNPTEHDGIPYTRDTPTPYWGFSTRMPRNR